MRKCALLSVVLLAGISFLLPAQASAQGVFLGAGATFPTADYADFGDGDGAKTGYMLIGGVSYPIIADDLSVFGEGFFGANSHEYEGDKTNLYGAMGGLLYDFADEGSAGLYTFAQLGLMVHSYKSDDFAEFEDSDAGFGLGFGAGFGFPLGSISGFVEGRYMLGVYDQQNTSFWGLNGGISIPFGRN
jgi:hypothetical protein